jgi:hypothetical protein
VQAGQITAIEADRELAVVGGIQETGRRMSGQAPTGRPESLLIQAELLLA